MCDISVLPSEVISLILDSLTFRERLALATVCKHWHDLVFGTKLCRQMILCVDFTKDLRGFQNSLPFRRCRRLHIKCHGLITEESTTLIEKLLVDSPVETLIVTGNDVEMKTILEGSLSSMKLLESLELRFQNEMIATMDLANGKLKRFALAYPFKSVPKIEINFPVLRTISIEQIDESSTLAMPDFACFQEINCFHFIGNQDQSLDFEKVFENMKSLNKLNLSYIRIHSSQLHLLSSLTNLSLTHTKTEFVSLRKSIIDMKQLRTLYLYGVTFVDDFEPRSILCSDSITEFKLYSGKMILIDFPNVENLSYISSEDTTSEMLEHICRNFHKLERLSFGVKGGQIGMFLTESAIAQINKLTCLKVLQLVRMSLDSINWSQCNPKHLQKIRLEACLIDGSGAQQLASVIPQLSELFLDHCYLRQPAEAFDIAENYSEHESLRARLARCRVSYYDCHVEDSYDTCSGGRRGGPAGRRVPS